jgi:aspartyl-tRNA(Asn)/glutamyl-tRNA(Gln) amidotransferase subunit C
MTQITESEVEHIAKLARVDLTEKEKTKFTDEIGAILDYVNKLNELDVKSIEPTAHVTGQENILRNDSDPHNPGLYSDSIINQFPETKDTFNKVKGVIKRN